MGNNPSQELERQIINLKLASKQLARQSAKAEVASKKERIAVKVAIEKGNADVARIHAENSIRQKSQSINFLRYNFLCILLLCRLSSRMEAVAQRVEASKNMQQLGISMGNVVQVMGMAIESMDMEKLSNTMDEFEKQFEQLDIQSNVMDKSIQSSVALSTPEDQVETLMASVADEYGLEVSAGVGAINVPRGVKQESEEKKLEDRLVNLKKA